MRHQETAVWALRVGPRSLSNRSAAAADGQIPFCLAKKNPR